MQLSTVTDPEQQTLRHAEGPLFPAGAELSLWKPRTIYSTST